MLGFIVGLATGAIIASVAIIIFVVLCANDNDE